MGHKRIHRTAQIRKKYPSIIKGSSQVNRSYLQRVMENPTEDNLTPDVVSQLQSTHGNQFVTQLMRQLKENTNTSSSVIHQSQQSETVQRKFAPPNNREAQLRNTNFDRYQEGKSLAEAFDHAMIFVKQQTKNSPDFFKWLRAQQKSSGLGNYFKRKRFSGYATVMDIIEANNKSDMASLMELANKKYFANEVMFLKDAHEYKKNPSSQTFHQIMEDYIYDGSDHEANTSSQAKKALIERAYRMLQGQIGDDGLPIVVTRQRNMQNTY